MDDVTRRACMSYWLPILLKTGVPVPETRLITTELPLVSMLEEELPGLTDNWKAFVGELRAAALEVGGYPAFLRTGHGSGKHEYVDTCHVPDERALSRHVWRLVEWSLLVDLCGLPTRVWAVRRFLQLQASFRAFGGLPINRERRYFIGAGRVICRHAYWPESAVAEGEPDAADWREKLAALNEETPEEIALLTEMSERVAQAFTGVWSLDWAQDITGRWWAIDMAPAERSYHWPGCGKGEALAALFATFAVGGSGKASPEDALAVIEAGAAVLAEAKTWTWEELAAAAIAHAVKRP